MRRSPQARQSLAVLHAIKGDVDKAEPLVRGDLPDKQAAENMAYYRLLGSGRETP
jgi:Flp pilus assembly protein TadD